MVEVTVAGVVVGVMSGSVRVGRGREAVWRVRCVPGIGGLGRVQQVAGWAVLASLRRL